MTKDVCILGIETSCDETAAAVIRNGREILSNVIYSQIDLHTEYGGVVPEIASRAHVEKINPVIRKALKDAGMKGTDLDAIAVTCGPGLVGPLLVGVSAAKALSFAFDKPLIGVHHIKGHIAANYLAYPELEPPFLCLVVSGGHTHLVMVNDYDKIDILGRTVDDAAGEAFDKIARAVGLGYPGGPKIDKAAREGNPGAYHFPKAKVGSEEYSFSFSGLKSCVLNLLNSAKMSGEEINVPDLAASFQKAVVDVLCDHFLEAVRATGAKRAALAGGVASNSALREEMKKRCEAAGVRLFVPPPILCTDNAAMIGAAAYPDYLAGRFADLSLNADPRLPL